MKKTKMIKAWGIFDFDGDLITDSVAFTRYWSKVKRVKSPVEENWKHLYKEGYRVRRITITVED